MIQMICLANSWRQGGRCVAGIDISSGEWVRPVPPTGGAIPESRTYLQGRYLHLLDVVELDLEPPDLLTRFQRENRQVRNWNWQRVREAGINEVLKYASQSGPVLHNRHKVVEPSVLEQMSPKEWVSLQLVHSNNVTFDRDPDKKDRWRADFSLGKSVARYWIPVTDPVAAQQLNAGKVIGPDCLLTISLTEPVQVHDKPELCYKLVAGVIEVA